MFGLECTVVVGSGEALRSVSVISGGIPGSPGGREG